MSRIAPKSIIISIMLLALLSGAKAHNPSQQEKAPDPLEGKSITVHTFLISVPNEILIEAGNAALPLNESESVTVEKLVQCLKKSKEASVVNTARATLANRHSIETSSSNTFYLPRKSMKRTTDGKRAESIRYNSYSGGTSLELRLYCENPERANISIEYSFTGVEVEDEDEDEYKPLPESKFQCQTWLDIPFGKPVITSSSQHEDVSTFLVVLAEIIE